MMKRTSNALLEVLIVLACARSACPVPALAGGVAEARKPEPVRTAQTRAADIKASVEIQQFCANNAAVVGDARLAWQRARLAEIESQVKLRLAELETKRAEYESWMRNRDEAIRQASDAVATIYAKMRPDAAAAQFAVMDDAAAAAILARLPARASSAILNEMEAGKAARLTRSMIGPDERKS